jgi:hypothetical protein
MGWAAYVGSRLKDFCNNAEIKKIMIFKLDGLLLPLL